MTMLAQAAGNGKHSVPSVASAQPETLKSQVSDILEAASEVRLLNQQIRNHLFGLPPENGDKQTPLNPSDDVSNVLSIVAGILTEARKHANITLNRI